MYEDGAYICFNANTYVLDILLERLRRDVPTIAEATPTERSPAARRRSAAPDSQRSGRDPQPIPRHDVRPVRRGLGPNIARADDACHGVIHDLFPRDAPHLMDRLLVTTDLLASWHFDEVAPEVLLEEMHTAAELMLKSFGIPRAKRMSFAELVDAAHEEGRGSQRPSRYPPVDEDDESPSQAPRLDGRS